MNVVIIDYGVSNLGSIRRAFEECGADVIVSDNPTDLKTATHVVLPGVGAFKDGMHNLVKAGLDTAIRDVVLNDHIPFLGVCLGMQLLATKGYEVAETKGLNLISAEVTLLKPKLKTEKIPHVGWNELHIVKPHPLLHNIPEGTDFYFVHSYHLIPTDKKIIIATTDFCGSFASVIAKDNVFGVQFHPEKSQTGGFQLIKNFIQIGNT